MESIHQILKTLLLSLSFGTFIFIPLVDPKLTGAGLIRLIVGVVLGGVMLGFVPMWLDGSLTPLLASCWIALLMSLLVIYLKHPDEHTPIMWFFYLLCVCLFLIIFYFSYQNFLLFVFLTTYLLGICNYQMLLGHYYLVVPKLSERPLINCLRIFWGALAAKFSVTLFELVNNLDFFNAETIKGDGFIYNTLFMSMRCLWGYLALFILSIFAYKLCKIRSIQSATGVFYVMVFFVLVGEIMSMYMYYSYGVMF